MRVISCKAEYLIPVSQELCGLGEATNRLVFFYSLALTKVQDHDPEQSTTAFDFWPCKARQNKLLILCCNLSHASAFPFTCGMCKDYGTQRVRESFPNLPFSTSSIRDMENYIHKVRYIDGTKAHWHLLHCPTSHVNELAVNRNPFVGHVHCSKTPLCSTKRARRVHLF